MKRLFILMVVCCLCFGCLVGCGSNEYFGDLTHLVEGELPNDNEDTEETPTTDQPLTGETTIPSIETQTSTITPNEKPVQTMSDDSLLLANFNLVCNQIGIDTNDIADMQQAEGWPGGPCYTFNYMDWVWYVFCNTDSTIEAICIGEEVCVFDRLLGSYHIDDYIPDANIRAQIEAIATDILKTEFNVSKNENLPIWEWYSDRTTNLYNVVGNMVVTNEKNEEDLLAFGLSFETNSETQQITLRYFSLGENILVNDLNKVNVPDRTKAVEQTGTILYSGKSGFLLTYGEHGKYGVEVKDTDGTVYIDYHIPAGKYTVTSKVPMCVVYVDDNDYYTNDDGHIKCQNISANEFTAIDEQHKITVEEGQHIMLTFGARVVFEPIS